MIVTGGTQGDQFIFCLPSGEGWLVTVFCFFTLGNLASKVGLTQISLSCGSLISNYSGLSTSHPHAIGRASEILSVLAKPKGIS